MASEIIVINSADNVGVAVRDIPKGPEVPVPGHDDIMVLDTIPVGHKIALCDLEKGAEVIKYGHGIGRVKEDVKRGQWIHLHNMIIIEEER
ncbi:MAG: UxaA family hydrolase [Spirochaetota bacterium]